MDGQDFWTALRLSVLVQSPGLLDAHMECTNGRKTLHEITSFLAHELSAVRRKVRFHRRCILAQVRNTCTRSGASHASRCKVERHVCVRVRAGYRSRTVGRADTMLVRCQCGYSHGLDGNHRDGSVGARRKALEIRAGCEVACAECPRATFSPDRLDRHGVLRGDRRGRVRIIARGSCAGSPESRPPHVLSASFGESSH